jgi:HEPN domain-containing protein
MSDLEEIQEWVAKAEEDFAGAVALNRRRKKPLPNLVCFHAQQCVEKYLKAYLIFHEVSFPRIHDLVALLDQCIAIEAAFERLREICLSLDPYSVIFRYPGQDAVPEEAGTALAGARKVRAFLRRRLPS